VQVIAALAVLLFLGSCSSAPDQSKPDPPPMTDRFGDGTPDFVRLDSAADRRAFRRWFTLLAESLYYLERESLPSDVKDCSGLLRFAYREALKSHDGGWATSVGLRVPAGESVRKWTYPRTPLGANLFRVRSGAFVEADLTTAAFAQFADAETLRTLNTHRVGGDLRAARPGDLLFYRQLEQNQPYHAMVFVGPSGHEPGPESYVVYHTGPVGSDPGEVRRPSARELDVHPNPRWRPRHGNGNFLGVYRWNILRDE
jgi:uncharacterized protein YfaT (DUF1175 family)